MAQMSLRIIKVRKVQRSGIDTIKYHTYSKYNQVAYLWACRSLGCLHTQSTNVGIKQWRSKNAEKITHIKGRSSSDSLQLSHFFKMGASLKGKNLLPERTIFFLLRAVPYPMENHFYHIR